MDDQAHEATGVYARELNWWNTLLPLILSDESDQSLRHQWIVQLVQKDPKWLSALRSVVVVADVGIDDIVPNHYQPRRHLDEQELNGLAASIAEVGVLQPLLVKPQGAGRYELIAGERRWRASRVAGLTALPSRKSSISA